MDAAGDEQQTKTKPDQKDFKAKANELIRTITQLNIRTPIKSKKNNSYDWLLRIC